MHFSVDYVDWDKLQRLLAGGSAKAIQAGQETDDDPENYLMDHSAITYLMGRDGKFVAHFGHGTTAEHMAERLKRILEADGK